MERFRSQDSLPKQGGQGWVFSRGGLPFPSGGPEGWGLPKLPAPVGEGQGWGQYSEIAVHVLGRCVEITDPTPNPSP